MARYEPVPIYRAAFDLAVHVEKLARGFTRYHKYSLGGELRERSREILARVIDANHGRDRAARRLQLRGDLENFEVMVRLCPNQEGSRAPGPTSTSPSRSSRSHGRTKGGCGRP